jgi:hypothetical protein
MFVLGATAQIVLITVIMAPLTCVAGALNLPLQDANLLAIDRVLGLDWLRYVLFVDAHPALAAGLSYAYTMIRWPIFAIPVLLAAIHRYRRLEEFTVAFALALVVTTVISALVPAIGMNQQIGLDPASLSNIEPRAYLDQVRDLAPVRDGALRHLNLFALGGLSPSQASMPRPPCSMHGRSGRCAGCGPSCCSPTEPCSLPLPSMAATISSI